MAQVPTGFAENYLEVIRTHDNEHRKHLCYKLICLVRDFLAVDSSVPQEHNFQDLADWYAELAYTWQRLRHYAGQSDPIRVHMWGIVLQNELNDVCGDFGLPKMELMSEFDFDNLAPFLTRADALEAQMRQHILQNGGSIREYSTPEEFLHEV